MRDKKIYCNNCNLEITKDNIFISNGIPYCKRCNQALENISLSDLEIPVTLGKPTTKTLPEYYRFSVAKYALTDVIESIKNSGGKEISVTKEDDELVVQYKPYWRK